MGRNISSNGLNIIKKYEGCYLTSYKCPAGVWTIGYGHTKGVKSGLAITQAQADALLKSDCKQFEAYVNNKTYVPLTDKLNQNQFDALVSFAFNVGPGNLKRLCTGRTLSQIANHIGDYNKASGRVLAGLTKRRAEETALFRKEVIVKKETPEKSAKCLALQKAINKDRIAVLVEDGICGDTTKKVLKKITLGAIKSGNTYIVGSKGETVKFIQKVIGLEVDGKFGSDTRDGVILWQRKHKLTPDGVCGYSTLLTMI